MEKILLFNVDDTTKAKLKKYFSQMHIRLIEVETSSYNETLDTLVNKKTAKAEPFSGTAPAESLMLFCDVADKKMDKLLFNIKKDNLSISYKSVLTPVNSRWTVLRLFLELEKERIAYANRTI